MPLNIIFPSVFIWKFLPLDHATTFYIETLKIQNSDEVRRKEMTLHNFKEKYHWQNFYNNYFYITVAICQF